MFIAGLVVAAIVWGLIFWSVDPLPPHGDGHDPRPVPRRTCRSRSSTRRSRSSSSACIFYFTVVTENKVDAVSSHPTEIVHVPGYRWGWKFTYDAGNGRRRAW